MDGWFIYLICHLGHRGPVKIGISRNPWGRMALLQTGNPYKLSLYRAYKFPERSHAIRVEQEFHRKFRSSSNFHLVGEWIDASPPEALCLLLPVAEKLLPPWLFDACGMAKDDNRFWLRGEENHETYLASLQ